MKAQELRLDLMNSLQRNQDLTVKIKTSNKSIGASSAMDIKSTSLGFDWDNGVLFINPVEPLVKANLNRDEVLDPINLNEEIPLLCDPNAKRITWLCRNCEAPISIKQDNYCRNCGQKLRER